MSASAGKTTEPVTVLTRLDQLSEYEDRWRELAELRGNAFVTPEWFKAWMLHYGQDAEPAVAVVRDARGELTGVLPLVSTGRRSRTLRFAGANLADLFHPAARVEDEDELIGPATAALADLSPRPVSIVFDKVEAGARWWRSAVAGWPVTMRATSFREDVLPLIEFEGLDWEAYLMTRSRNLRSQVRRRLRALESDHELRFRATTQPDEVRQDVATFFRLHDMRWGERGGSDASTELSRAFHADFATAALERGWLRLWFMELDGETVAAWYGWRLGSRYSYYQAGFDPSFEGLSVGFALLAHTMRSAIEEDAAEYDLLLGGEAYKLRFATASRAIETVVVARRGRPRSLLAGAEASLWRLNRRIPPRVRKPALALYRGIGRAFPTTTRR